MIGNNGFFGSLFPGMNVNNMSVSINFPQGMMNDMLMNQHHQNNAIGHINDNKMIGIGNNPNQPLAIEFDKTSEVCEYRDIESKFIFDKMYIDEDYKLHIMGEFDMNRRPNTRTKPLNSAYIIVDDSKCKVGDYPESVCMEICARNGEYPPILTIVDVDNIVNRSFIDEAIFHLSLLCVKCNHNNFFLVLEETGSIAKGEPFRSSVQPDKGLFRKTIYNIILK